MSATSLRGRRGNMNRPCTLSTTMREKRTVDVVKSVLTKVKERMLLSGPLLTEEETAINQLEKLYVTKFLQPHEDDSVSILTDGRKEADQWSSPMAPLRRDSDASFSNDTLSSSTLLAPRGRPKKDRDYYKSRDPWKRHWQRRKRVEMRKLVEPLSLRIDEARGVHLVDAVLSVYEDLLHEGKRSLEAYDLLITTLRSYFTGETWPDLVDAYVVQFVQNHILLSAAEISEKYSGTSSSPEERFDEYKLQALLHLFALPVDVELRHEKLDEAVEVIRIVLKSFGGSTALQNFLDEEILETFLDIMPGDLAYVYQELDISLPVELKAFGTGGKGNVKKDEQSRAAAKAKIPTEEAKPSAVASVATPTTPKKRGRPPLVKPVFLMISPQNDNDTTAKIDAQVDASKPKKIKIERSSETIEKAVEPKVQKDEIPSIVEEKKKRETKPQCRPKTPKCPPSKPVAKIVAETPSASSMLVSVRQSPRHHASTRALNVSASNSLSLLLQKEQTDGTSRNDSPVVPAATTELLNDSTRLVLVKDKRGYFLKKFLHDGGSPDEKSATDSLEQYKTPTSTNQALNLSNLEEEEPEKTVGKLTLKLKKGSMKKKASLAPTHQGMNGKSTPSQVKTLKKTPVGRTEERHRLVANSKSKGSNEIHHTTAQSSSGRSKQEKNQVTTTPNGRNEPATTPVKTSTKSSKPVLAIMDSGASKSSKSKSGGAEKGKNAAYVLPSFAVENYTKHINDIRRERKRARIDPEDGDELFYARGTRRHSIFYDGGDGDSSRTPASKCYSDEQMAPKNRTGRKMKSSVEVFHLANYLLNIQNANPSTPAVPKNLQQALNTPIRLYKKLRLAPKNNRRRSLRQFCALKFNADEFKNILDNASGTSNSSTIGEERSTNETDECASLELNCVEPATTIQKEEPRRHDLKMTLSIDTRFVDNSQRRNSVSICAGLTNGSPKTWSVNGGGSIDQDEHSNQEPKNGYYLRRRRLFSDGHVSSRAASSIISPDVNGGKRSGMTLRGRTEDLEEAKKKFEDIKNGLNGSNGLVLTIGSRSVSSKGMASSGVQEKEYYVITDASLCGQLLDRKRPSGDDEERSGDSFLNELSSRAGGLLQLANPSSLLCPGLTAKNYAQVAADVR